MFITFIRIYFILHTSSDLFFFLDGRISHFGLAEIFRISVLGINKKDPAFSSNDDCTG
jgi:hypothetical protein